MLRRQRHRMNPDDPPVVTCPHCQGAVVIEAVNCAIFRHGVFRRSGHQVPPHAPKADCDAWVARGEILGCGRPFRVMCDASGSLVAVVCDYI